MSERCSFILNYFKLKQGWNYSERICGIENGNKEFNI